MKKCYLKSRSLILVLSTTSDKMLSMAGHLNTPKFPSLNIKAYKRYFNMYMYYLLLTGKVNEEMFLLSFFLHRRGKIKLI
jgi:hypothetical protein